MSVPEFLPLEQIVDEAIKQLGDNSNQVCVDILHNNKELIPKEGSSFDLKNILVEHIKKELNDDLVMLSNSYNIVLEKIENKINNLIEGE